MERRIGMGRSRLSVAASAAFVAVAVAGCGASPHTRATTAGGSEPVTAASGTPSTGSVATGTGTTPPGSVTSAPAGGSGPATTVATTAPGWPDTTTTAPAAPPVDGTGVRGKITAGPTCPVERPDMPCPPNPVQGRVDALDIAGHLAGTAMTDQTGRYALALPPGRYTLPRQPRWDVPPLPRHHGHRHHRPPGHDRHVLRHRHPMTHPHDRLAWNGS